jgi:1-acyl-sn-glycerol-3-phosphate acyltransferase
VEPAYRVVEATLFPLLGVWFRWTIEGRENIPERGPAILACNHVSYLDPLAMAYAISTAGRRPRFLAKSELFRNPILARFLRMTGQIEVERGTARAPLAFHRALEALARGEIVVIFPEGTVTTDPDLQPMAPKSGAVRLALRAQAPLIPCATWGTANVWPKGDYARSWRRGQDVLVRIGEPMTVEGDSTDPATWRRAGTEIMGEIARLVAGLKPLVADLRRPLKRPA